MHQALLNLHSHSKRKIQRSRRHRCGSFHSAGSKVGRGLGHVGQHRASGRMFAVITGTHRGRTLRWRQRAERSVDYVGTSHGRWKEKEERGGHKPTQGSQVELNSTSCSAVDFFCSSRCTSASTPWILLHVAIRGEHKAQPCVTPLQRNLRTTQRKA